MLIVTQLNKTEMLNHIQSFEMEQEVNGTLAVSFLTFKKENNPGYELLIEESTVSVEGFDFKIKQLQEKNNSKKVLALSTFFDLGDERQDTIYGGTRTFNEFATFTLQGTGWTFSSEVTGSRFIENFGEANVLTLINALCKVYECEYEIRPNNHVHFSPKIGPNRDAQYRYGHNVKALTKNVDTTKLKTYIEGYGANNLFVSYTSPNASNPLIGIRKAEPIRDDRFTVAASLIEHIKGQIVDEPEAYFELDSVELTSKELGERVWLIYEPLGISFQTRVLKQTKTFRSGKLVTIKTVLGNTVPKSNADILVSQKIEIDENRKEFRSRIEQTNERILLEVEAVNDSIASLDIKADSINLSVTQLNGRLGNAEASINVQAGLIQQTVKITDFNGQTITSKIVQDPYAISQMAQNLNLQGLVTVTNLKTPGQTIIDGGNIYGSSFVIGRGTGSLMTMTAIAGSHVITSNDSAGMAIQSNNSLSLRASGNYGVYVPNSPLVAGSGFRVEGGVSQFNTSVTVNSTLNASTLQQGGIPVATQSWVGSLNYVGLSTLNQRIAQLETDIKVWANGKFVIK